jgi:methylated-DNA-[protein]-cysteine S-methyltransferase
MKKKRAVDAMPKEGHYSELSSPVGRLTIITSVKGVHAILWASERDSFQMDSFHYSDNTPLQTKVRKQLDEYFRGERYTFCLPLVIEGTDFQKKAWAVLSGIPYGETISYGEQAIKLGDKNKARAVGGANGKNLLPILIPCHRVIGQNKTLTGFGGGVDKKACLLALEAASLSGA